ncbi:MAG: phage tail tape measure protein, partial [Methanosarcinales archaeon]
MPVDGRIRYIFEAVGADKVRREIDRTKRSLSQNRQEVQKARKETASFSGTLSQLYFGLGIAQQGYAMLDRTVGESIRSFASFEQSVLNAASVAGGTEKAIRDLMEAARDPAVAQLGFTSKEAADALYYLASAGYNSEQASAALQGTLAAAAATGTDLAFTTQVIVGTLNQFGMSASDATKVADIFQATIANSQATMDRLGTSMAYVGPIAAQLGWSLGQTTAALGILYNAGIDASMAGTSLRAILSTLMTPTKKLQEFTAKYGLTLDDVNPKTHSFVEILEALGRAGIEESDIMETFGRRAGPALMA